MFSFVCQADSESWNTVFIMAEEALRLKEEGNACFKKNMFLEARQLYTAAIMINSTDHVLYSNCSITNLKLGLPHLAASDAEQCVQICPEWSKGYLRMADAYLAMSSWKKAADCLEEGIRLCCGSSFSTQVDLDSLVAMLKKSRSESTKKQMDE